MSFPAAIRDARLGQLGIPSRRVRIPDDVTLGQNALLMTTRVCTDEPTRVVALLPQLFLGDGGVFADLGRSAACWTGIAVISDNDVVLALG